MNYYQCSYIKYSVIHLLEQKLEIKYLLFQITFPSQILNLVESRFHHSWRWTFVVVVVDFFPQPQQYHILILRERNWRVENYVFNLVWTMKISFIFQHWIPPIFRNSEQITCNVLQRSQGKWRLLRPMMNSEKISLRTSHLVAKETAQPLSLSLAQRVFGSWHP